MVIILYGCPGVGKTYFAGTSRELNKDVHYYDIEIGAETLDLIPDKRRRVREISSYNEFKNIFEKTFPKIKNAVVVIDSMTELQTIILNKISARKDVFDLKVASMNNSNQWSTMFKDIMAQMKKWAKENNNILILITGETVMEKRDIVTPDLRGKLGQWVVSAVNACVRLDYDVDGNRTLYMKPHENESMMKCLAKTRCTDEECLLEPTLKAFLGLIGKD